MNKIVWSNSCGVMCPAVTVLKASMILVVWLAKRSPREADIVVFGADAILEGLVCLWYAKSVWKKG